MNIKQVKTILFLFNYTEKIKLVDIPPTNTNVFTITIRFILNIPILLIYF
ncbi:hypothetical protein [Clostridium sp.]